jgi:hypothetical protein
MAIYMEYEKTVKDYYIIILNVLSNEKKVLSNEKKYIAISL